MDDAVTGTTPTSATVRVIALEQPTAAGQRKRDLLPEATFPVERRCYVTNPRQPNDLGGCRNSNHPDVPQDT